MAADYKQPSTGTYNLCQSMFFATDLPFSDQHFILCYSFSYPQTMEKKQTNLLLSSISFLMAYFFTVLLFQDQQSSTVYNKTQSD